MAARPFLKSLNRTEKTFGQSGTADDLRRKPELGPVWWAETEPEKGDRGSRSQKEGRGFRRTRKGPPCGGRGKDASGTLVIKAEAGGRRSLSLADGRDIH